jgi:hypothetical protein
VFECLGISQLSSLRTSFFQDVVRSAAAGCTSIGIWRSKVDELGVEEAVDLVFEMKLAVSSLSWCGGFTGSEGGSFAMMHLRPSSKQLLFEPVACWFNLGH